MGKRKAASVLDRYPNRKLVTQTFPGASSTLKADTFDTGIQARQNEAWEIERIRLHPLDETDGAPPTIAGTLMAMLTTGEQTDFPDTGIADRISLAQFGATWFFTTNGGWHSVWPLTWVGPRLTVANKLTCMLDCSSDLFNSDSFVWEIEYFYTRLADNEWREVYEQEGVL